MTMRLDETSRNGKSRTTERSFANPCAIEYTQVFLEVLPSAVSRVESRPSPFLTRSLRA